MTTERDASGCRICPTCRAVLGVNLRSQRDHDAEHHAGRTVPPAPARTDPAPRVSLPVDVVPGPCIAGDHFPNDDGTACAYCGLPAEPATADPVTLYALAYWAADAVAERDRAAILPRLARNDRAGRRMGYQLMHPGAYPPAGATWPDAGSFHEAREALAPTCCHDRPATARRQREHADMAANIARYWRLRELPARIAEHHAAGDTETAAYLADTLAGRISPAPDHDDAAAEWTAVHSGAAARWPILRVDVGDR